MLVNFRNAKIKKPAYQQRSVEFNPDRGGFLAENRKKQIFGEGEGQPTVVIGGIDGNELRAFLDLGDTRSRRKMTS